MDGSWRISSTANELRLFDNVYPGIINDVNDLPIDEHFSELDSMVVDIFNEYDTELLHDGITDVYNVNNSKHLFNHDYFNVYLFKK